MLTRRHNLDRYATHLRIGVVRATVRSPIHRLRHEHRDLYAPFCTNADDDAPITIDVIRKRLSPWPHSRYEIRVNGRMQFAPTRYEQILPYVEWAMNWEVPRVMPGFLQLHASSMEVDGQGVVFPGDSGNGKSTLTVGLLSRGWRYLCDEFAMIHSRTLRLNPYPRAICLKRPSFPIAARLGINLRRHQCYLKGVKGHVAFVNPLSIRPNAVGRTCPIRHIIFPKYVRGSQPRLTAVSRAEAAFDLHRVCFNLFHCEKPSLEVIAQMIRGAQCHRLVSSDIERTCDLLQSLVQQNKTQLAQTA